MIFPLLLASALALQEPVLRPGETVAGETTDEALQVRTEILDAWYTDSAVVARAYRIEVEESGAYNIDLRSYAFDPYLVLRDEQGVVLTEDDDGLIGLILASRWIWRRGGSTTRRPARCTRDGEASSLRCSQAHRFRSSRAQARIGRMQSVA